MHHDSCKRLHFGLMATTLAGAFGCNSHPLVPPGDPQVVIIDPPPVVQPPPLQVQPGLPDARQTPSPDVPPVTVRPLTDGAIPDAAVVVRGPDTAVLVAGPDAAVVVGSPDTAVLVAGPDAAAGRDVGRDAGREAGPEAGPCSNSLPPRNFPENPTCQGTEGGLGEAFQKALWFLNVNKSGPGVINTYVQWRGDAHVMDQHIKLDPAA
jgi:hypothetical protein